MVISGSAACLEHLGSGSISTNDIWLLQYVRGKFNTLMPEPKGLVLQTRKVILKMELEGVHGVCDKPAGIQTWLSTSNMSKQIKVC